jgi:predicted ATPase
MRKKVGAGRVRIEELRLAGFRAFENARLDLDDLTILVGRNGAGKSTIIDAFEFLRDALSDSLENALERRGGILALANKASRTKKELSIAVRVRLSPEYIDEIKRDSGLAYGQIKRGAEVEALYGFRLQPRRGGAGFVVKNEILRREEQDNLNPLWPRDALGLPILAQYELIFRALLEALRTSIRAYNFSPAAIRAEPPIGTASVLLRDGSNAGDVLRHVEKYKDDLAWIIRHLGAVTPGIVGLKSGTAAGRRIVQFFQGAGKSRVRFNIGDMSDGTLRCLAILLALRQRPTPAIVCIDEIEDSVHPAALGVLLDAIAASTERCQVLLTSHSPEALSHPAALAKRIRIVEWRDGRSNIFRLSQGAEEMSKPPRSVGKLLRSNALFPSETPARAPDDFFEGE